MTKCAYCHTSYSHAGLGGPAEDCDCGRNWTQTDLSIHRQELYGYDPDREHDRREDARQKGLD